MASLSDLEKVTGWPREKAESYHAEVLKLYCEQMRRSVNQDATYQRFCRLAFYVRRRKGNVYAPGCAYESESSYRQRLKDARKRGVSEILNACLVAEKTEKGRLVYEWNLMKARQGLTADNPFGLSSELLEKADEIKKKYPIRKPSSGRKRKLETRSNAVSVRPVKARRSVRKSAPGVAKKFRMTKNRL